MTLRRYLKAKIKWLQENEPLGDEIDTLPYDAAEICREARRRAVAAGLPDVAAILATVKTEALELTSAKQVVAEALACS